MIHQFIEQWKDHTPNIRYPDWFDPYWVCLESGWPWFSMSFLDTLFDYSAWLDDAQRLDREGWFVGHRSLDGYGHQGWRSCVLHGLGDGMSTTWDQYHITQEEAWEQYHWCNASRGTTIREQLIRYWPAEFFNRVRIMALDPGGYIQPHRDLEQHRLTVCNISLNNPPGCQFVMANHGTVPFKDQGSALLLDIANQHGVYNPSTQIRYHMIVHYEIGDRMRDMFYVLRESFWKNKQQALKNDQ